MAEFQRFRTLWQRLNTRQRFILLQIILFASAVLPLGLYRLSRGEIGHAVFDGVLLLILSLLVWLSLSDRFLDLATRIMSITYVIGVFGVVHLMGEIGLFWAFAAGLGSFFAVKSLEALVISVVIYLLIVWQDFGGADLPTMITFSACFALVAAFGYYFSSRLWQENERLDREAHRDRLTNLLNRRSFDDDLALTISDGSPLEHGYSMLVIDLDDFKGINDMYGHAAGDRVLKGVAEVLERSIPKDAKLYRFGGEEFVILCRESIEDARNLGESLRLAIGKADLLRSSDRQITVSIGVSERRTEDDSRSWFHRTDGALYRAKQNGRNQVAIA